MYPAQGLGTIVRLEQQDVGGAVCDFFIVQIRGSKSTLMVPVSNAAAILRKPVDRARAGEILAYLDGEPKEPIVAGQNWNRRFREYSERLKSRELMDVASVVRELSLLGRGKELSFGERKLMEQALPLLASELAEAMLEGEEQVRDRIMAFYPPLSVADATPE